MRFSDPLFLLPLAALPGAGPSSPWAGWAAALGVGLLIGLDRERRKGQGPRRGAAGLRSFAAVALLGALAQWVAGREDAPALLPVTLAAVAGLAWMARWRRSPADPGLTTELALLCTCLIGALAQREPALGAAVGVALAGLLAARERLHRFATGLLSQRELHDGLLLAALCLIALPLVPPGPQPALAGLDLRRLATLWVLLLALQAAGHVAMRLLGARAGALLAGLAGGFVSSTATVASVGSQVRQGRLPLRLGAAAAVASGAATWVQAAVLVLSQSPALAGALLPAAAVGLLTVLAGLALLAWAGSTRNEPRATGAAEAVSALSEAPVLRWRDSALVALLLTGITLAVGATARWLGPQAATVAAGLAGLLDAHAGIAAVSSLGANGTLAPAVALAAMLAALASNTLTRAVVAFTAGGPRYGVLVGGVLAASTAAAWALVVRL